MHTNIISMSNEIIEATSVQPVLYARTNCLFVFFLLYRVGAAGSLGLRYKQGKRGDVG